MFCFNFEADGFLGFIFGVCGCLGLGECVVVMWGVVILVLFSWIRNMGIELLMNVLFSGFVYLNWVVF